MLTKTGRGSRKDAGYFGIAVKLEFDMKGNSETRCMGVITLISLWYRE